MPKQTFLNLPEEKRQRIVELAIEEFSAYPFRQASLSRIVSRAGIAKGSIYQYFEDKLDLYRWLVTEELSRRRERTVPSGSDTNADLSAALEALYLAELRLLLTEPRLWLLSRRLLEPGGDAEVQPIHDGARSAAHQRLHELLDEARLRGEVRKDIDLELAVHLVESALGPGLTQAVMDRLGTDLSSLPSDLGQTEELGDAQVIDLLKASVSLVRQGLAPVQAAA